MRRPFVKSEWMKLMSLTESASEVLRKFTSGAT